MARGVKLPETGECFDYHFEVSTKARNSCRECNACDVSLLGAAMWRLSSLRFAMFRIFLNVLCTCSRVFFHLLLRQEWVHWEKWVKHLGACDQLMGHMGHTDGASEAL